MCYTNVLYVLIYIYVSIISVQLIYLLKKESASWTNGLLFFMLVYAIEILLLFIQYFLLLLIFTTCKSNRATQSIPGFNHVSVCEKHDSIDYTICVVQINEIKKILKILQYM